MNDEVVASLDGILPASSGIFTCLPAGNELFQSGAAESMRDNTCTEAEERGEHMRCWAGPAACTGAAASCTMAMPSLPEDSLKQVQEHQPA